MARDGTGEEGEERGARRNETFIEDSEGAVVEIGADADEGGGDNAGAVIVVVSVSPVNHICPWIFDASTYS